jgi:hypothetical protein
VFLLGKEEGEAARFAGKARVDIEVEDGAYTVADGAVELVAESLVWALFVHGDNQMREFVWTLEIRRAAGLLLQRLAIILVIATGRLWRRWRGCGRALATFIAIAALCGLRQRSGFVVILLYAAGTEVALAPLAAVNGRGTAMAIRAAARPFDVAVAVEAALATTRSVGGRLAFVIRLGRRWALRCSRLGWYRTLR